MKKPKMIRRIKRMTLLMLKWRNESNAALADLHGKMDENREWSNEVNGRFMQRVNRLDERVFGGDHTVPMNGNIKPIQVQFDNVGGRIDAFRERLEAAEQTLAAHSTIHDGMDTAAEAVEKALQTNQVQFKDVDDKFTKVHSFSCELADRISDLNARFDSMDSGVDQRLVAMENRIVDLVRLQKEAQGAAELQSATIAKLNDTVRRFTEQQEGPSYTMIDGEIVQLKGVSNPWIVDAKVDSNIDKQYQFDALEKQRRLSDLYWADTSERAKSTISIDADAQPPAPWSNEDSVKWFGNVWTKDLMLPFGLVGWRKEDDPPRWSEEYFLSDWRTREGGSDA